MALRIDYFQAGEKIASVPCPTSLGEAKATAMVWLVRFNADWAEIHEGNDGRGAVAIVKRDG